jgi:hypothetical protein
MSERFHLNSFSSPDRSRRASSFIDYWSNAATEWFDSGTTDESRSESSPVVTRQAAIRTIDRYKRAIEIDPMYALAWAWLSTGYNVQPLSGWVPAATGYARAREAAQRALTLDPKSVRILNHYRRRRVRHVNIDARMPQSDRASAVGRLRVADGVDQVRFNQNDIIL